MTTATPIRRPPPSAGATAQRRLAAMLEEVEMLRAWRFADDDLPDRGLVRSLIGDVHGALDGLERRLGLCSMEIDGDRRSRASHRA